MTSPLAVRLAVLVLGGALLVGCSGDEPALTGSSTPGGSGPDGSATTAPAEPSSPSGEPSTSSSPSDSAGPAARGAAGEAPPFAADTTLDEEQPSGGPLTVTAVRAARQQGFDRVVLELAGEEPGEPGWRVAYVDEPRQDGSGDLVEVAGERVLEVVVTGVGYPFDTGQEEASTDLVPTDTAVVREVDLQATFEGQFQAFVGLSAERPFRVFRLADPARVVIDVQHP